MNLLEIRSIIPEDQPWITLHLMDQWGSPIVISRGNIHQADQLPGYISIYKNQPAGLITYQIKNNECEIISLDSLIEKIGVGTALIEAVKEISKKENCTRLWLITTNDNTHAIRFYQKRSFRMVAVHRNAIEESRKLKPGIPLFGFDDIPIRDEIEFEIPLT